MAERVTVYGAEWCGDTRRTLRYLETKQIAYDYVDVDEDEAGERKVIEFSRGKRRIPLVEIESGSGSPVAMAVPTNDELERAMKAK